MDKINLIQQIIDSMEMESMGLFTGFVGVLASMVFVNGKKMSYRKALVLAFAGTLICGYTLSVLELLVRLRAVALVLNVFIGLISIEIFVAAKLKAPFFAEKIINKGAEKIGANDKEPKQ